MKMQIAKATLLSFIAYCILLAIYHLLYPEASFSGFTPTEGHQWYFFIGAWFIGANKYLFRYKK